jgi:HD-like signal output (HDOD) protein
MLESNNALYALIIDPDPAYLAAIRRLLTRSLINWHCDYCADTAEGMSLLQNGLNPHLVISDSLDTDIANGEDFLNFVQEVAPAAVRVLMSAENSVSVLLATTQVAHMVIGKPFNDSQLLAVFGRVERLVFGPFTAHSRYQIGLIQNLPVAKNNYQSLMALLNDPETPTKTLAQALTRDATITAKLLQIANSDYLGFSRQVLDLNDVIIRLGREMIKAILMSVQMHSQYEGRINAELHEQLLNHSFSLAMLANQLAKTQFKSDQVLADKAFMAGLLQVLGPLVLLSTMPPNEQALTNEDMFQDGIADHCLISAYLMTLWGFDDDVCQAVMYRLNLAEIASPTLLQTLLHLATYILLYQQAKPEDNLPLPCFAALEKFNLSAAFLTGKETH